MISYRNLITYIFSVTVTDYNYIYFVISLRNTVIYNLLLPFMLASFTPVCKASMVASKSLPARNLF